MKIAVLILAHKNPEQLELLVKSLYGHFEIFIHLDKKWQLAPDYFKQYAGVQVIKKYDISWASFKISKASLDLFRMAHRQQCDYYLLISGQDFPIMPPEEIRRFLDKNSHLNFMEYRPLPIPGWGPSGGYHRLQLYWPEERGGILGMITKKLGQRIRRWQLQKGYLRRLQPLQYYGGCNWVNINHSTLSWVLQYLDQHPAYLRQFRFSYISDEIWLHTLVLNSPFKNATINNWLRYIDWGEGAKNPKTLGMEDLDKILNSRALFARKLDLTQDRGLFERLYALYGKAGADSGAVREH